MLKRVGLYSWAGPGTERIIKTKYFNPKIDHDSLSYSYDYDYLVKLKELFGVTDAWVSYSWGFSDEKELEDHKFTLDHLKKFKKLKIKTHAYLQGCNLVYEDFKKEDFWCRDQQNRLITYYKGRKVACVNNPHFSKFFEKRLKEICSHSFDGVYVDNIQMGQLGIPVPSDTVPYVFAGCRCQYCQVKFFKEYGQDIPVDFEQDIAITQNYLNFRVESLMSFVATASNIVHSYKKQFVTNSYDPKFDTRHVYGFDVLSLEKYQDYMLFENHALHTNFIDNRYIEKLKLTKPVFVVSYKRGIGFEKQYEQKDFDLIFSEAKQLNFFPLLKASEFTTNGVWHNLRLTLLAKPNSNLKISYIKNQSKSIVLKILQYKIIRGFLKDNYNQIYTSVMENRFIRPFMNLVYVLVLH
jgi:hypothetical protein